MKTLIYAAAILCLLPVSAMAQSGPKIEISPGGERKFDQNYDRERDRDRGLSSFAMESSPSHARTSRRNSSSSTTSGRVRSSARA